MDKFIVNRDKILAAYSTLEGGEQEYNAFLKSDLTGSAVC
jgi:hypothetical protein